MKVEKTTVYNLEEEDIRMAICESIGISPSDSGARIQIFHRFKELNMNGGGETHYFATVTHTSTNENKT